MTDLLLCVIALGVARSIALAPSAVLINNSTRSVELCRSTAVPPSPDPRVLTTQRSKSSRVPVVTSYCMHTPTDITRDLEVSVCRGE